MRVMVWIAAAFLFAVFAVIALIRLALEIIRVHDSPA
jgi:hypothetical protein